MRKMWFLKVSKKFFLISLIFLVALFASSSVYGYYGIPFVGFGLPPVFGQWPDNYEPLPDFSNWIWTDPWTAYDPVGGGAVSVDYITGGEWQSPYFQQIGYTFGYPGSLFPWSMNPPGVYHPFGAVLNWLWNQAFDIWPVSWEPISWGQWSPYVLQGGNPYYDGLYSPLGIPPSSYDQYDPVFILELDGLIHIKTYRIPLV